METKVFFVKYYLQCIVLTSVDELLNCNNNIGQISQLSHFLAQSNKDIFEKNMTEEKYSELLAASGHSACVT